MACQATCCDQYPATRGKRGLTGFEWGRWEKGAGLTDCAGLKRDYEMTTAPAWPLRALSDLRRQRRIMLRVNRDLANAAPSARA